jgi:hypothetical protein
MSVMSKESQNKKNQARKSVSSPPPENEGKPTKRFLTDEEKAWIIKERLAKRPVIVFRYRNGKWNRRLILMLALMAVALVVSLIFLTRY